MIRQRCILTALILTLLAALPAAATLTVYTDRSAWETSLGGAPVTEDFSGDPAGNHDTPFTTVKGTTFTTLSGDPITIQVVDGGLVNGSRELHVRDFGARAGVMLASSGRGFGFDYDTAIESWTVQVGDQTAELPADSKGFIGFINDSGLISSFTLRGSLAGGAQGGLSLDDLSRDDVRTASPGELHNRGVQFVLEHIASLPSLDELNTVVLAKTQEYCASVGQDCSGLTPPSRRPEDPEQAIAQLTGSRALKRRVEAVFDIIEIRGRRPQNARSLRRFEDSLGALESSYRRPLSTSDAGQLSDLVSVAQSSGRFWASAAEGGLNGLGHLGAPIPPQAAKKIDWVKVVIKDVLGCAEGAKNKKCVGQGVFDSAVEVIRQVVVKD